MVTLSPPTSEVGVRFPALPHVGELVVACHWLAVYSTEPWPTVHTGFLCHSNYLLRYDLYSVEVKPQTNKLSNILFDLEGIKWPKGKFLTLRWP